MAGSRQQHHPRGPPTVLNIAEKPSVARALAAVFSRMPGSQEGPMRREAAQIFRHENVCFPSIFAQGQGQMIQGPISPHIMITTSVRGHLASQDFGPAYGWKNCDPIALFDAPIETLYRSDMEPLERMLRQLAQHCTAVILWLDCDREGEAIGDEVRACCWKSNPNLPMYRARFSTVLQNEIQRALSSLGLLNESFVQAVQARSELDLRVGAAFTRFQTLRLQKKFDGFSDQGLVVSYGPCQFPTLGFVVERWARIETFVPEDFWYLELMLRVPSQPTQNAASGTAPAAQNNSSGRPITFSWNRGRLYDRIATTVLYAMSVDAGEAVVTQLTGRPRNKWRPVPLATVELQKRASKYLRIGSETLMTAAEELYQSGYISYPRTETEKYRAEFEHQPLLQDFSQIGGEIGVYASKLLTDNHFQNPRAGSHDDQAHPPITPCKAVDPNTIADPTQRSVYLLVVKHYLACCSRDALGKETQLVVRMAQEEFTAKGLMILERNWLEIYAPWEHWSTGQGELPPLEVGSRIVPSSFIMKEGRTTAPPYISEVELISLMDRNGIGTDATIAQHISTIQERKYAIKDANQTFRPTQLGIALIEGYNSMGYQLNKPDLRRETEAECNLVAQGQKRKDDIMGPILAKMRECFVTAAREAYKLDAAVARHFSRLGNSQTGSQVINPAFSACGVCQNLMALKQVGEANNNRRGNNQPNQVRRKLLYCNACEIGWPLPRGQVRPKTEAENGGPPFRCPICSFQVVKIERGDGYDGNGYHVCPKCFSEPPPDLGGAQAGGSDFRCFSCLHTTCALAGGVQGGDTEVFPCPFCGSTGAAGKVTLRKNSRGFVLSCSNYSAQPRCTYTIWLPKESRTVNVAEGNEFACPNCSRHGHVVHKIKFDWKPGSVPPHLGRGCTVCILCDVDFRREMEVSLPQPNQVMTNPRRRVVGRGGARVAAVERPRERIANVPPGNGCYRCGQPGHFANACPQNSTNQ